MNNEVNSKYDVTDLTSLEKLEPVRVRPGMYIGSTGTKGLHHCIWEILDNSIDEISNGFGDKATIFPWENFPENPLYQPSFLNNTSLWEL